MTDKAKKNFEWIYRAVVISFLTALVGSAMVFGPRMVDAVNNRTFDTYEQKVRILQKLEEEAIVTEREKERIMLHMADQNRHMNREEKEGLIIIRENQRRIGEDLQEIKGLLRQR